MGTTEKGVLSVEKGVLTSGQAIYAMSIVRDRVGSPRGIVHMLSKTLSMGRRRVQGGIRGVSSVREVRAGIRGDVKSEVQRCSLRKIGMSRSCQECCPCKSLTSGMLKFAKNSGRKVVNLRIGCSRVLGKRPKGVLAIASTHNIRVSKAKRQEGRPISKGALHADLSIGVRRCIRRTTNGIVRRGRTREISVLLVGPRGKRVCTYIGIPRFSLGSPFALGARRATTRKRGGRSLLGQV